MANELEAALSAAREAGKVLLEGFGRRHSLGYTGGGELVTEMDGEAERTIREVLLGTFPTHGILAEESGERRGKGDARWIVDPLDGTTNYAHGLPVFCVSVALERAGEVVLGVVHDPMREETFVAERAQGATLDGRPIRVSETDEPIRALISTGFPYDQAQLREALELFGRFAAISGGMRRLGSAALDLCYVASGRLDGYYEDGQLPSDIAAGQLILKEAGGRATDYRGGEIDSKGGQVVASNGLLHPAMIELTGDMGPKRL